MLRKRIPVLCSLALLAVGCLIKETTSTLYLEPDGSVTWRVLEEDVRSDEEKPVDRSEEEVAFVEDVWSGEHHAIAAMRLLGATRVDSRFLRDRRPYTLLTEGEFPSLDGLLRDLLDELGVPGYVEHTVAGDWNRLVVLVDVGRMSDEDAEEESPVGALFSDTDTLRLLLVEGRFRDARGFDLIESATVAVLGEPREAEEGSSEDGEDDEPQVYCLTWTTDPWAPEEPEEDDPDSCRAALGLD